MNITAEKMYPRPAQGYLFNCRVDLSRCTLQEYDRVLSWTVEQEIPCTWTANWAVYLSDKDASLLMMRWS